MKVFFAAFIALFFIYNVKFKVLQGLGTTYLIFLCLLFLPLIYRKIEVPKSYNLLVFMALLVFCFTLIPAVFNPYSYDLGMIKYGFIASISIMLSPYLYHFLKVNFKIEELFKVLGYASLINAIVIFAMFLSPTVKFLYLDLVILEIADLFGDGVMDGFYTLRMIGVTGFAGYATAFTQMFCVLCYYYYLSNYCRHRKLSLANYAIIFLVIVSSFISARSTIVGIGLLFVFMLFDRNNIKRNTIFCIASLAVVSSLLFALTLFLPEEQADFFMDWVLEFFNSGLESGSVSTNIEMFIFGYSDFSLLGDARLNSDNGNYYMGTDVGYFRVMFSIGYVGMFIVSLFYTFLLNPAGSRGISFVFPILLFVYIFVFMLKGAIILSAFYLPLILAIFRYIQDDSKIVCSKV